VSKGCGTPDTPFLLWIQVDFVLCLLSGQASICISSSWLPLVAVVASQVWIYAASVPGCGGVYLFALVYRCI
jgi:hypothetical protein